MSETTFQTPIPPSLASVASLHSEMVARLANTLVPPDPAMAHRVFDQGASLRANADYLAKLQSALEPVIRGVVTQSVRNIGLADVRGAERLPFEILKQEVLAPMRKLADEIEEQAIQETGRNLPWLSTVIS
jgi:hypothetical protein